VQDIKKSGDLSSHIGGQSAIDIPSPKRIFAIENPYEKFKKSRDDTACFANLASDCSDKFWKTLYRLWE
jgi:hypothetical protein